MSALWTRTVTLTPIFLLNGHIAGRVLKASKSFPYGIGNHGRNIRLKELDVRNCYKLVFRCPMYGIRAYSEKTSGSVPPSPPPTPPNLPDRAQVEKAFFRVVAFFWDYGFWLFAWSRKMIKTHIIEKPIVKFYWKRFHDKMEEAKKDT